MNKKETGEMNDGTSVILDRKLFDKVAHTLGPKGSGMMNGAASQVLAEIAKIQTSPDEYAKYSPCFRRLLRRSVMKSLNLSVLPNDNHTRRGLRTIAADVEAMAATEDARWRIQRFAQYIASTPAEHMSNG